MSIPAKKWGSMETVDILGSIDTALRVLRYDKKLSKSDLKILALLICYSAQVIAEKIIEEI